jgi:DNA-binding response OmpR family regulator
MDNYEENIYINNEYIEIDKERGQVNFQGKLLELTIKEYGILNLLSLKPGVVFTRKLLLEKVWGYDYYGDSRAVDIQIRRLRKRIEPDPNNPKYILTKWGEGYFYRNKE